MNTIAQHNQANLDCGWPQQRLSPGNPAAFGMCGCRPEWPSAADLFRNTADTEDGHTNTLPPESTDLPYTLSRPINPVNCEQLFELPTQKKQIKR
mmetsp:Transcript_10389/g.22471  ORF Transcript_10389/g.22471 Transcript_10389/m.22471 type:complete len:95 (-) Transcript_10389:2193-2477(-)